MNLTEQQQETIKGYGVTCRELAEKGAAFNLHEAHLFHASITCKEFAQCEALIQTLRDRVKS